MFTDLHLHSTESDGTDTPEIIVEKIAAEQGIKIFALTDHDTISGVEKIKKVLPREIFFIYGVEFSCKIAGGIKCHILAYFYDSSNEEFQKIIRAGNERRKKNLDIRLNYLAELYKINFSDADIKEICSSTVVGKPHIVNFVSAKYGIDRDKLFKDLKKCYVADSRQGEPILSQAEFEIGLPSLIDFGINGLECYYFRYTDEQEKFLQLDNSAENLWTARKLKNQKSL